MTYKDRGESDHGVMDLNSNYRSIVRKCFPNANIVADRFHVIGMINHHFMEFCRQVQESIRWKRPIIRALRKRACNPTARERQTLQELFELHPAIGVCHEFKEKLGDLLRLKSQTVKQCSRNIGKLKEMMRMLEHEAAEQLKQIGVTISKWFLWILGMWR